MFNVQGINILSLRCGCFSLLIFNIIWFTGSVDARIEKWIVLEWDSTWGWKVGEDLISRD